MTEKRRMGIAVHENVKFRIQQLRLDLKLKTEEDVLEMLLDFYNNNGDPLVFEAIDLIKKIREGK